MATKPASAPRAASNLPSNLMRVLSLPWLDRTIAAIACVPLVYGAYYRYQHFRHGLPLISYVLNVLICIGAMVTRRPPKRVTPNPWFWLLAFVASQWSILVMYFLQKGRPLTSNWISDSIAIIGILVAIFARFSLGRNIGMVPAQRELVQSGRTPISCL